MIIQYTQKFKKQYKKLPSKYQKQFDNKVRLFLIDPTNPQLCVHPLVGTYRGYWSININGDLRVLYLKNGDETIIFALLGTHSQLYG